MQKTHTHPILTSSSDSKAKQLRPFVRGEFAISMGKLLAKFDIFDVGFATLIRLCGVAVIVIGIELSKSKASVIEKQKLLYEKLKL